MTMNAQELKHAVNTLSLLSQRGFPMQDGLKSLSESNGAWLEIEERVKKGDTTGQALRRYPNLFSPFFSRMVETAEQSPEPATMLNSLSRWLETAEEVRRQTQELLYYPILLLAFLFLELGLLFGFALPSVILPLVFADTISRVQEYDSLCMAGSYLSFFLAALTLVASMKTKWLLPFASKFPGFRSTLLKADQALWAKALGGFLQGGTALPKAIEECSGVVWNEDLEQQLLSLPERLDKGDTLGQALSELPDIDPHLRWAVTAGENNENLSATLFFASEQLERGLITQCRAFFLFLQPMALAVVGLLTASVLGGFWYSFYHYSWNLTL